jgi:hypothetical protein
VIIDCHTHLNNYHEQVAHTLSDSVANLRAAMREAGVDYSLVLTSYIVNPNRPSVRAVIDAIGEASDLGIVAGISYLNYKVSDLRELADDLPAGSRGSSSTRATSRSTRTTSGSRWCTTWPRSSTCR